MTGLVARTGRALVGKRGLAEGKVEVKLRRAGEKRDFELEGFAGQLEGAAKDLRAGDVDPFDALFA